MFEGLQEVVTHVLRHEVLHVGPVVITSTVVTTWVVMAILLGLVFLLTRRIEERPRGAQAFLEIVVDFFYGMAEQFMGREGRRYVWLYGGLFTTILFFNYAWMIPGGIPPTSDLVTPIALAVVAVPMTWTIAIRRKGFGAWVKHFFQPTAILAPLNVLEQFVRIFSLSVRLFGNMFGEEMVTTTLATMLPLFGPLPIMALGLIFGGVQAFVFSVLTVSYLAEMVHGH
ncbi:F0F1 ATP synthase subunit A [Limnochorda pilosa]|uniref:ATP synthase subunit a n=1 Tax=Limnochorda pilosa TaxID=1555112 RepID=A0A0K2SP92_LIMPI|nr:F0F1 ATP synthase subunit A [Limnochorda pilosa]BAS28921.1 F0F1 ATP synthase subunit A [Limnochorda pilosa]